MSTETTPPKAPETPATPDVPADTAGTPATTPSTNTAAATADDAPDTAVPANTPLVQTDDTPTTATPAADTPATHTPDDPPAAPPASPTQPPRHPLWQRIVLWSLAVLLVISLGAAGMAGWDAWRFLNTPAATPGEEVFVDVDPGASFDKVSQTLERRKIITSAWRLRLLAEWKGWQNGLKVGRFQVHTGWTPERILDQLINGQPVLYRITIREGLTWWETARLLEAEGFVTFDDFKAVIHDAAQLRHWGIPFANAEGFLFPETYLLKKPQTLDRASAKNIAGRLVDTFWRRAVTLWPEGRKPDADTLRTLLTLASIVEKETAVPSERPRVAGVYTNRLRIGMILQADPTVIYGLGTGFDGNLRRSHLQDDTNPYNTYRKGGLPPGPICSPGFESLKAASRPEKHQFLYFVARGDGSHVFSTNLDDHNKAVRQYLARRQGNGGTAQPSGTTSTATAAQPAGNATPSSADDAPAPASPEAAQPATETNAAPASTGSGNTAPTSVASPTAPPATDDAPVKETPGTPAPATTSPSSTPATADQP